ncbi:MAG: hypothetical protein QOI24_559 [Acidobacteriota bacterium]|jgi:uncharacterized YigZ family protein|nr:hypothetical protein [Acidobacteriota bacterium]
MASDHFQTLAAPAELRQKIERSDFLAIAFPVTREEDFFAELTRIEKRYFDATHHCWAFRLFTDGRERSSDAGEPSGSAGKPILAAIDGAKVHDAGVVVVRWYGGVKLGTGGLARAYRDTATGALRDAKRLDRYVYTRFRVIVPFEALNTVYRLIEPPRVVLVSEEFAEENVFTFDVRASAAEEFAAVLTEKRLTFTLR